MATTSTERDYSHRSTVRKLAVKPDQRLEVSGDIGHTLASKMRIGRPPDRGARYALEDDKAGACRAPDAVQQRQDNADADALFDW